MTVSCRISPLAALALSVVAPAQPQYSVQLLGPAILINDMCDAGDAVGWTTANGDVQAWIAGTEHPFEILPLPTGYRSAWAQGINDAGVVVGSTSTASLPEFGEACAWIPDGLGGYSVRLLGALPGHTQSVAYAVNNCGDIVGVSIRPGFQGGPTVWFNSPTGVLDVSALGAPSSPRGLNDDGVMVGWSGGLFDLDTLQASPLPTFPSGWSGFQGWAINNRGELAGTGIHGGSRRSAAIWTAAGGWESISPQYGISASVQAFDISDGGLATAEIPQPAAHFPGSSGSAPLGSLLPAGQRADWSFLINLGNAVDSSGRIAAIAVHNVTQDSGVAILTPDACQRSLGGRGPGTASATMCGDGLGAGQSCRYAVVGGPPSTVGAMVVSRAGFADARLFGGTLVSFAGFVAQAMVVTDGLGRFATTVRGLPPPAVDLVVQTVLLDGRLPQGIAFTEAVLARFGR